MARRRRRSHRRYGAMVQIPGLGMLDKSVNTTDVLVGAGLGFAGTLALKGLGNKMLAGQVPDAILKGSPLVGGIIAGGLAYLLESKKNKQRATGHLFGALTAGAAVQAWDVMKTSFPTGLGDVVSLKLGRYAGRRGGYGVFVNERTPAVGPGGASLNGLLVNEPGRSMSDHNLAALAGVSMGDGESSGMEQLMDLE